MTTPSPLASAAGTLSGVAATIRRTLPRGRTLPDAVWQRRHRVLLGILWAEAFGLFVYAQIEGYSFVHAMEEGGLIAAIAACAVLAKNRRRLASAIVSFGLISASAVLVHLSGGVIEAHFSFFVMIALLSLYEDWLPFLLAAAFVVLHHGVVGVLSPEAVYNHPDAVAHPWRWALVHGLFVTAAGIASVATWRLNEDVRAETLAAEEEARRRTAQQARVADLGQRALQGVPLRALMRRSVEAMREMLGVDVSSVLELHRDTDSFEVRASVGLPEGRPTRPVPTGNRSQAGYTVLRGEPVIVSDWQTETRFSKPEVLREVGARSGATVSIQSGREVFGVLGVQSIEARTFSAQDVHFLQAVANVIANAIERRSAEEDVRHQALHDPLTELPNRSLFLDRLGHALAQAHRREREVAVLFCDLDQFKLVNDSLGHEAGDGLLRAVARRLDDTVRAGDTVARFGGDEFGVLVEEMDDEVIAVEVAERVAASLARPFDVDGHEHFVTVSIGIAIGSGIAVPEALIRDADAAMYRAKEQGRGRFEIFNKAMRKRSVTRLEIENDLRRAVERGEMRLHYQPIVSTHDRAIAAVEALVRWQHPERGLLAPNEFIGVAEDSGLIVTIGRWVLEEACRRGAEWQRSSEGGAPLGVCVNLSPRQLSDPNLPSDLERLLTESGMDPATLSLEITENALLEETAPLTDVLDELKGLGCKLLLDDFGTGFSSLGYVKRFPLDGIKIDRSFVTTIGSDVADAAIVRAIVGMADDLSLRVIAEGVETVGQLRHIEALGCRYAQGYLFARPVPPEDVTEMLRVSVEGEVRASGMPG